MNELVARELLDEKQLFPEVRLSFAQALIRDVAYRGLLLKSRAELHARAGRALETLYADRLDEVLHDLARHFGESGEPAQALRYRCARGCARRACSPTRTPRRTCSAALALVDAHADLAGERGEVLDRLGEVAFARGLIVRRARALDSSARRIGHFGASSRRSVPQARGGALGGGPDRSRARRPRERARAPSAPSSKRSRRRASRRSSAASTSASATTAAPPNGPIRLSRSASASALPDVVSHAYNTLGVAAARAGELERGATMVEKSLETALGQRSRRGRLPRLREPGGDVHQPRSPPLRAVLPRRLGAGAAHRRPAAAIVAVLRACRRPLHARRGLRRGRARGAGRDRARSPARAAEPSADPDHHPRADLPVPRRLCAQRRALP